MVFNSNLRHSSGGSEYSEYSELKPEYRRKIWYDRFILLYTITFTIVVVYYLVMMNNTLNKFNTYISSQLNSAGVIGNCLFGNICTNSIMGKQLCGTCYSNRTMF